MEILFVNEFKYTMKFYDEYYKYLFFKRPVLLIFHIIFSAIFIAAVISLIFSNIIFQFDYQTSIGYIFLIILFYAIQFFRLFRAKKRTYNRNLEINKGKPFEIKISVTENKIIICTNTSNAETEFANIKEVMRTKNYYLLISRAKQSFIFKKDGFKKGALEEFEEFLRQKGFRRTKNKKIKKSN